MDNLWSSGDSGAGGGSTYLAALVWEWWAAPWHGWAAWLDASEQLLRIAAEWAEAIGGEMMEGTSDRTCCLPGAPCSNCTEQPIPPEMTVGHCAICAASFQYSKARLRPPKTCGMWACMVKAREEVAT